MHTVEAETKPIIEISETEETEETKKIQALDSFDASAKQRLEFTSDGNTFAHLYNALSDERYIQFSEELEVVISEQTTEVNGVLDAITKLWDDIVYDVEGYEDTKPSNWKSFIDPLEKEESIDQFLGVIVYEKAKTGKRSFTGTHTLILETFFNGKIARTEHEVKTKTIEDVKEYKRILKSSIRRKQGLNKKDKIDIAIADTLGLQKLCQSLRVSVKGYANNDVPIWHDTAVAHYWLTKGLDDEKK